MPFPAVRIRPNCGEPLKAGGVALTGGAEPEDVTTSRGAEAGPISLLASVSSVVLSLVNARLTDPLPVTSGVTSIATQAPVVTAPLDLVMVAAGTGASA